MRFLVSQMVVCHSPAARVWFHRIDDAGFKIFNASTAHQFSSSPFVANASNRLYAQ
jgi:hypothetical protein